VETLGVAQTGGVVKLEVFPMGRSWMLFVPPEGGVLRFRVEPPLLYRGDNILYLYRLTRRSDPEPWLALASVNVRGSTEGVIGFGPGGMNVRVADDGS